MEWLEVELLITKIQCPICGKLFDKSIDKTLHEEECLKTRKVEDEYTKTNRIGSQISDTK